jgi:DNA (cytosine-5)-methyltransferase 1
MTQLVLSLFPGIGLLDRAFEEEGFCVVRGPDVIWGGDVRRFHPPAGRFDGVIGGPPCQMFSRMAFMVRQNGLEPKFGNLIPEFERCVLEAAPQWFIMENVPDAPMPFIGLKGCGDKESLHEPRRMSGGNYGVYSFLLNNRQCVDDDGKPATQNRTRRWSFGWRGDRLVLPVETECLENPVFERAALGGSDSREIPIKLGGSGKRKTTLPFNAKGRLSLAELCRKQGLPEGFTEHLPFTAAAACKAIGNGVPLPMGRAIARAVKEVLESV